MQVIQCYLEDFEALKGDENLRELYEVLKFFSDAPYESDIPECKSEVLTEAYIKISFAYNELYNPRQLIEVEKEESRDFSEETENYLI